MTESKSSSRLLLIFNPYAGFGKAKKFLPQIETAFSAKNLEYEVRLTEYAAHATRIVATLDFTQYSGIVVAGGDGSVFDVLNGYMANKSANRIPIGIIPVGTGNAFVRDLNLRTNQVKEAVDIIAANNPVMTDLGEISLGNEKLFFLNVVGMGFITDVQKVGLKMKVLGNISYTLGVLYQIIFLKKYQMEINLDGKIIKGKTIFVEISNSRYTSNFLMAPNALLDDGLLDVTILNPMSRYKMLTYFPSIFTGEHIHKKGVDSYKAKSIRIVSEKSMLLAPDGELRGNTPFSIQCIQKAIPVFR